MSNDKVIYSKNYPTLTPEEEALLDKQIEIEAKKHKSSLPETAEEFLKDTRENTVYVLNKDKYEKKDVFLNLIKKFAEIEEADITITEKDFGYSANMKLCVAMYSGVLKKFFLNCLAIADSFDILPSRGENSIEIVLSLDYYTHDRYYKGEKMNNF